MVGGMLLSVAITAFLTGVTSRWNFLFMFDFAALYLLHAIFDRYPACSSRRCWAIPCRLLFRQARSTMFLMYNLPAILRHRGSAGDGRCINIIYFLLFSAVIRMFNLKTPGREDKVDEMVTEEANSSTEEGLNATGDQLYYCCG